MKLEVLQENLAKGLSTISRIISSKAQLPILNNVLLTTDKGRLKFSATNLQTGINFWIGAKIQEKGSVCISAKTLAEFVSSLPAEKVTLQTKQTSLKVTCANFQAEFVGLPVKEFPAVPTLAKPPSQMIDNLTEAIPQVSFAAAQDETRPVLSGVLFAVGKQTLQLVATDGYRLSVKKIPGDFKNFKKKLIIPSDALNEISKINSETQEKIGLDISLDSNQIIFVVNDAEIISRLIEGDFPEFEKVIPEQTKTKTIVEKESLLRAVRIASIFARESANIIKFEVKGESLIISANAAQVGENVSKIEAKTKGEPNKIAFNSRYLLDFLNSVKKEQISIELTDPLSPGIFRPVGDSNYLHVIMPVRVQE